MDRLTIVWVVLCFMGGIAAVTTPADAQCDGGAWPAATLRIGFDGISCIELWTPPGSEEERVVVAGPFRSYNGTPMNGVAVRVGDEWQGLGDGFDDVVNSVAVLNGELVAAGAFTASGSTPVSRIARWNGTDWMPLGAGLSDEVYALAVFQDQLYAVGKFQIGTNPLAGFIARWSGTEWSGLGSGMNGIPKALVVHADKLIAAGSFSSAGGVPASRAAAWNGTAWSSVGGTLPSGVDVVDSVAGTLYIAGAGTSGTGQFLRRLDGTTWTDIGAGVSLRARRFFEWDGAVFVAGDAHDPDSSYDIEAIRRWNGSSWESGSAFEPDVIRDVLVHEGRIVAVGLFPGGLSTSDGATWTAEFDWIDGPVYGAVVHEGNAYFAGDFRHVQGARARNIASFDGERMAAVGDGLLGEIEGLFSVGDTLYVTGEIKIDAAQPDARLLVAWDGGQWSDVTDTGSRIDAMVLYRGEVYAGGFLGSVGSVITRVGRLTGASWEQIGVFAPTFGRVESMAVWNDRLVVAGTFTSVDGIAVNGLASWDGETWTAMDAGIVAGARSLVSHNGDVFASMLVDSLDSVGYIARWNGVVWDPEFGFVVSQFAAANNRLLATAISNGRAYLVERFVDGWRPILGSVALDTDVSCALFGGEVLLGGDAAIGPWQVPYFARWSTSGVPSVVHQPADVAGDCARIDATFEVVSASGYDLFPRWYFNGVAMDDGAGPGGATLSGATTTRLLIENAGPAAQGEYTCRIATECGHVWSEAATLSVCPANYNCDGAIDILDFLDFFEDFSACDQLATPCGTRGEPDINGDAMVDILDLLEFLSSFGEGCD